MPISISHIFAIFSLLVGQANAESIIEPYSQGFKTSFNKICNDDNQAYCDCFINTTEQRVPIDRLLNDLKTMRAKFVWEHPYLDIGFECREKLESIGLNKDIAKK